MSLANRVDAVHAEFRRRSALSRGGEVVADGGLLLWAGPTSAAIVVNGLIRTDSAVSADEALRAAEHFFGVRSRGYTVFCRSDVDSDLATACRDRGHHELAAGGLPEMVLHDRPPVPELAEGVAVREVATEEDRSDYLTVFAAAYALVGASADTVEGVMPPLEMLQGDDVGAFVVTLDGAPAAVAMSVLIDGVVRHPLGGHDAVGGAPGARRARDRDRGRPRVRPRRRCRGAAGIADGRRAVPPHGFRRALPLRGIRGRRDVTGCTA